MNRNRNIKLDLLRCFAALWVVMVHWFPLKPTPNHDYLILPGVAWVPKPIHTFASCGYLGVDIFFILSGVVIAQSALGKNWISFSRARFLRLFPGYFICSILALVFLRMASMNLINVSNIFALTGLQFWVTGPFVLTTAWTLPIEILFYALVAAAIFWFTRKGTFDQTKLATSLNIWLTLYLISSYLNFELLHKILVPEFAPYFILGASISSVKTIQEFLKNSIRITLAFSLVLRNVSDRLELNSSIHHKFLWSVFFIVGTIAFIIYSNLEPKKPETLKKQDKSKISSLVIVFALMTYPLYLLHAEAGLAIVSLLSKWGVNSPAAFGIAFVVVCALAYVVILMEKYVKELFKKYVFEG